MFKLLSRSTNAIVIITAVLVFWLSTRDWVVSSNGWQKAEGALIDKRYQWRDDQPPDTNIVLIGVETSSLTMDSFPPEEIQASLTLQQMSQPFPWNREVYAAALDKVMDAGAKVVVFDFIFGSTGPGDDTFAEALKRHSGHVVLGAMYERLEEKLTPPNSNLLAAVTDKGVGLASTFADPDEVTRRGTYRTSKDRESRELRDLVNAHPADYPDDLISLSARAVEEFQGSVHTPPYGRDNFIDFQGPSGTYRPIPIETLFVDKLWNAPPLNGATTFRNKIVIIGPIANIFHDIHATPFGDMPGPELQAQMMATLLHRSSLSQSSPAFDMWLTIGMITLALTTCLFVHNAALKPALLLVTTIGFFLVCRLCFTRAGVVVYMMPPLFGFIGTGAFGLTFQYILEQFERRRTRAFLDRYVSKSVARLILDDKRSFEDSLNGRKKSCTVLFSDIRGFTSMTEGRDPEQLVKQLNEYFLEMVGAVLKEDGSLQKFIGDAIMAAWGDVRSDGAEEDARRAVRAALDMRASLVKLNQRWEKQPDRMPLHIGIGVNEGDMIVGNIGHPQRMEFTVLGDGVNLASRLESATKQFHADLLVGETVEALTRNHFIFRRVGLLTVKGKTRPVEAFDVLGESTQPPPPWLAQYHEAIRLFRNQQFEAARELFKTVLAEMNGKDYLCQMYIERCGLFLQDPPPADWNGTLVLTEK